VISTPFSLPLALGGAAVLVAAITALYLLKVRRRRIALAGAPLWQQAQRQAPPRLLGGRFRRPLAWLLSLLIVMLLWWAAAGLRGQAHDDGREHLFYLDGSAWLLGDGRFDAAREAVQRDVAATPGGRHRVVLGGQVGALLLAPGEPPALLAARLRQAQAQALPSTFPAWLRSPGARVSGAVVHYYGAQPVFDAAGAGLAEGAELRAGYLAPAVDGNRGIVSLGSAAAASGRWDAVDVQIVATAASAALPAVESLQLSLDGQPLPARPVAGTTPGSWWLRDLPAAGGLLAVQLAEADGFPADDTAALRLPLRRPLPVTLSASVPAVVRDVIAVDPSLQLVSADRAQVQVLAAGDAPRDTLPALRLIAADTAGSGAAAFRFQVPTDAQAASIAGRLAALGLDQAGNTALAEELRRPVGVDVAVVPGARRDIAVWRDAVSTARSFTSSPAWPLFVNRSLHWLADEDASVPYAAAGTILQQDLLLEGLGQSPRVLAAALGDRLRLPAAGQYRIAGQPLAVSLLDRTVSEGIAAPVTASVPGATSAMRFAGAWPAGVMLLLALVLAALEWQLHIRGRLP
jgi:hypothetical protein